MVKKTLRKSWNSNKKFQLVKVDKQDVIELKIPSLPQYVSVACSKVSKIARQMSFDKDAVENINLSVSEACTNVIKHAYKEESASNVIVIRAGMYSNKLDIVVTDTGRGFKPKKVKAYQRNPMMTKTDESLGQGIFLMKNLMDKVEIVSRIKKGTRVHMIKNLTIKANGHMTKKRSPQKRKIKEKVLVVEESKKISRYLCDILNKEGYEGV